MVCMCSVQNGITHSNRIPKLDGNVWYGNDVKEKENVFMPTATAAIDAYMKILSFTLMPNGPVI